MDELANPYQPGAGSPPPALVGRDELLHEVDVLLARLKDGRQSRSLITTGLRGVGKTVLLNRFREMAEERGLQTIMIEATEGGKLPEQLAIQLRAALFRLSRNTNVARFANAALRVLKSFSVTIGSDGLKFSLDLDPEAGSADSGDLATDLGDVLEAVGKAAKSADTAFLIAIDELQYLEEAEFAALIMALHRIVQRQLPVSVIATGLPQIAGLAGEAKSYAERLFTFPRIGALGPDDTRAAISEPAARLGVSFASDALDELVRVTQGYPYFIQEWTYRVWNAAPVSPITRADVDAITALAIRKLDESFFRVRFDRLTDLEKQYLRAMAEFGGGPARSGDVAAALGRSLQSAAPTRDGLIKQGMIYSPRHGDLAFTVPLFDDFMRRSVPLDAEPSKTRTSRRARSPKTS